MAYSLTPWPELTAGQWATLSVGDYANLLLNDNEFGADMDATIITKIDAHGRKDADLSRVTATTSVDRTDELTDGSGDNQVDRLYQDRGTVSSGGGPTLVDLYGSLPDDFGVAFAFGVVKVLQIHNTSGTDTLLVGNAASNPWVAPWGSGEVSISPGGTLQVTIPVAGLAVGATNRNLRFEHGSGAGGEVEYELVVLGVAQ